VASSSRHVSLEIWRGTLVLETMGGNAVLLIEGPVSELGDLCCKNWTTDAGVFIWLDDDSASVITLCT